MSADYEIPAGTSTTEQGEVLRVVRHYSDGIFFLDPVKVVLYDAEDRVVAETGYYRDVVVTHARDGRLKVYGVGLGVALGTPLANRYWLLQGRALAPLRSLRVHWDALTATLRARWLGYGFSIFLCTMAMHSLLSDLRLAGAWDFPFVSWQAAAIAWLALDLLYGRLSVVLILCVSLLPTLRFTTDGAEVMVATSLLAGGAMALRLLALIARRSASRVS